MADLKLVIGSKNSSSWSLRPWLLLKQAGPRVRGGPDPAQAARDRPGDRAALALGQGAGAARGRRADLGLARDLRVRGRADRGALARGAQGPRARPLGLGRDACGLPRSARLSAARRDGPLRPPRPAAFRRGARRRAHPDDLAGMPPAVGDARARSCSASSRWRTRCTRPWPSASTPTRCRSTPSPRPMCARSSSSRRCRSGPPRPRPR